jgi:hypothetical protein
MSHRENMTTHPHTTHAQHNQEVSALPAHVRHHRICFVASVHTSLSTLSRIVLHGRHFEVHHPSHSLTLRVFVTARRVKTLSTPKSANEHFLKESSPNARRVFRIRFQNPVVFTFSESGLFFSFFLFFVLTCCKLGALDFIILPVVNYLAEFT